MSKKNKANKPVIPFTLGLNIDLDGLEGIPEDQGPAEIARNWLIRGIIDYSEQSKGLLIAHHIQAKRIRDLMEAAVKTDSQKVELEPEDYRFLKMCWEQSKKTMHANEVIVRVNGILTDAQSEHDRRQTGGEVELSDKPVSSQEIDDIEDEVCEEEPEASALEVGAQEDAGVKEDAAEETKQ